MKSTTFFSRQSSIRTSLVLRLGLGLIAVSAVMTFGIGRTVYTMNISQITKRIVAFTQNEADVVELQMQKATSAAEAFASTLSNYESIPEQSRRNAISEAVRSMVSKTTYKSIWAAWKPGAFDSGSQYSVCWVRDSDDTIKKDVVSGLGDDWFTTAMNSEQSYLDVPSQDTINGKNVLITSSFAQIRSSTGQPAGVAGIDIILGDLDKTLDGESIFAGTQCQLLNTDGAIMAATDTSKAGETSTFFTDAKTSKIFAEAMKKGSGTYSDSTTLFNVIAIHPDRTESLWYLTAETPLSSINKEPRTLVSRIIMAFIAECIIVMIIMLISVNAITKPLNNTVKALDNISEGDGDLTVRLSSPRNDEVGQMCLNFNKTMEKIGTSINNVKQETTVMENTGSELASSMKNAGNAVNDITTSIHTVQAQMQEHSAGVEEAKAVVDQIVKNIQMLNENIDSQAASVTESSSSIEQMTANINSVSKILQANKDSMESLEKASGTGMQIVNGTTAQAQHILEQSDSLVEASEVIKSIAEQTNLLAMNAAIEAAHAGATGKGFSVVAEEIRKLAEESNEESSKIQQALSDVKTSIDEIATSSTTVQEQFNSIFTLTKTVSQQEHVINDAMQQQDEGGQQILEAIKQINSITSDVKSGSNEMLQGSKEVSIEMDKLTKLTETVRDSMNDMSDKTLAISYAAAKANESLEKNNKSIKAVSDGMDKFKV